MVKLSRTKVTFGSPEFVVVSSLYRSIAYALSQEDILILDNIDFYYHTTPLGFDVPIATLEFRGEEYMIAHNRNGLLTVSYDERFSIGPQPPSEFLASFLDLILFITEQREFLLRKGQMPLSNEFRKGLRDALIRRQEELSLDLSHFTYQRNSLLKYLEISLEYSRNVKRKDIEVLLTPLGRSYGQFKHKGKIFRVILSLSGSFHHPLKGIGSQGTENIMNIFDEEGLGLDWAKPSKLWPMFESTMSWS